VALPALAKPNDPRPGQGALRPQGRACQARSAHHRLLRKGCLAGGMALPINGQTWQVMRLSRNRNWGIRAWCSSRAAGRPGAEDRLARAPGRRTCRNRAADR